MQRITERNLREVCIEANQTILKDCHFGLKVERSGSSYRVYKLFRKAGEGQELLTKDALSPKEVKVFLEGFLAAVTYSEAFRNEMTLFTNYALSCHKNNPDDWMTGLLASIQGVSRFLVIIRSSISTAKDF